MKKKKEKRPALLRELWRANAPISATWRFFLESSWRDWGLLWLISLETGKPASVEKDPVRTRSMLYELSWSSPLNGIRSCMSTLLIMKKLLTAWKERVFGRLWGIMRFLRNLSPSLATLMEAWHTCLVSAGFEILPGVRQGRRVFYHHSCFFLKDYSEREKRNPVDTVDTIGRPQLCWWLSSPFA